MSENTEELLRLLHVHRLPVEYHGGRWHCPSNAEPDAVVAFHDDGWNWWMNDGWTQAATYEAAIKAAQAAVTERKP